MKQRTIFHGALATLLLCGLLDERQALGAMMDVGAQLYVFPCGSDPLVITVRVPGHSMDVGNNCLSYGGPEWTTFLYPGVSFEISAYCQNYPINNGFAILGGNGCFDPSVEPNGTGGEVPRRP